ncbi:hypothetical protein D3C71_1874900 [compost metagenome]
MVQVFAAAVAMALAGMLLGWILRKRSDMSVLASRLVGLAIMLFVAPTAYLFASGAPYFEAFFAYGLGAVIAGTFFYFLRSREQDS